MIGVSKHVMFQIGCSSRASNNLSLAIGEIMDVGQIVTRAFDVNLSARYFSMF
jgi:hypothetical protein